MEHPRSTDMGRKNARLLTGLLRQDLSVSGLAQGTNTGSVGSSQGPFGQVVDQDSFRITTRDLMVVIVKYGPDGADGDVFTDDRYWAREVYYLQDAGSDDSDTADLWISTNQEAFWGVVRNTAENITLTHGLYELNTGDITTDTEILDVSSVVVRINQTDGYAPDQGNYIFPFVPGTASGFTPVLVKWNAGSDGDATHYASWTYDLYALTDTGFVTKLNTSGALQPTCGRCRTLMSEVTKALNGSVGNSYKDKTGAIKLFNCPEIYVQATCDDSFSSDYGVWT